MANINTIISDVATALASITTINGFAYNIGTISPTDNSARDEVKVSPSVDISWDNDRRLSDGSNVLLGYSEVEIILRLKIWQDADDTNTPIIKSVPADPEVSILDDYGNFLADIRGVLAPDAGYFENAGNAVLYYEGSTKDVSNGGDVWSPYAVIAVFKARYQQLG